MVYEISKNFPDILQDIREFQEFARAINPELEILRDAKEQGLRNQYIETCDETGIARLERLMKITPPATATLEERRLSVKTKWNSSTPFSERKLISMLDALCTHGYYTLTLKIEEYSLRVLLELEAKNTIKNLRELLEEVVPQNMLIEVKLRGNTYGDLKAWGYTYGELKEMNITYGEITYTVLRR